MELNIEASLKTRLLTEWEDLFMQMEIFTGVSGRMVKPMERVFLFRAKQSNPMMEIGTKMKCMAKALKCGREAKWFILEIFKWARKQARVFLSLKGIDMRENSRTDSSMEWASTPILRRSAFWREDLKRTSWSRARCISKMGLTTRVS
jgi:hypothetical protein